MHCKYFEPVCRKGRYFLYPITKKKKKASSMHTKSNIVQGTVNYNAYAKLDFNRKHRLNASILRTIWSHRPKCKRIYFVLIWKSYKYCIHQNQKNSSNDDLQYTYLIWAQSNAPFRCYHLHSQAYIYICTVGQKK